ncbi:FGGY-family carbohydrate kinase [Luxibacter massiliensis]|uniref:FGGY-family carbohydrate kinase n=1 Tax=Luxibacter massiliensis TaxID=2219695 RepID=UPI000F05946E|nr:FGGY-family carbohydrate kinase [Luxibacter massiliensis]
MEKAILVADFGTSKVHINLIEPGRGRVLYCVSRGYRTQIPRPGYAEIDPLEMWEAVQEGVGLAAENIPPGYKISGISFSYFGDSIMAVDQNKRPLTNLILAFDGRAKQQQRELSGQIGETRYRQITGGLTSSDDTGAKILWLKENAPDIYRQTKYYYTNQQFILHKLGLIPYNDMTMASRKMLFDVRKKSWSKELTAYIGISEESLGRTAKSGTIAGEIKAFGKVKFADSIPVVIGAHDCDCGMVGAGLDGRDRSTLVDITGTWDHLGYIAKGMADTEIVVREKTMHTYCGPVEDSHVCLGAFPTSGAVVEWFMKQIVGSTSARAYQSMWDEIDFTRPGSEMFYPDFAVNRGKFTGLGLGTDKGKLFRALIESLTFEARGIMEICEKSVNREFSTVCLGGGTAKAGKWAQLRADVFGKPVAVLENTEISSLGAAVIAMNALGIYSTIKEAADHMVRVEQMFYPKESDRCLYHAKYAAYKGGKADGDSVDGCDDRCQKAGN